MPGSRAISCTLVAMFLWCAGLSAQSGDGATGTRAVDFYADFIRPYHIGDSTVTTLVGHVIFYHNGAVMTCDSAVRYSDRRMDCFGNVAINQKTTYVYGDRVEYDGNVNTARVFAPLIKIVDDDATMYTYNFTFNTLDRVGEFFGGATMVQGDNLLESERGYYYVEERRFVCVDRVEVRNPDYKLRSDSVAYDLGMEMAEFFVKTDIWNSGGEILSADRGRYYRVNSQYIFSHNAYILTADRELWADSLDYNSVSGDAEAWNNIQMRDEEQKVMAFGDYGTYWGQPQNAMMTRDPSIVSFDPEQDSVYVRADSIFLFTVPWDDDPTGMAADSVRADSGEELIAPVGGGQDDAGVAEENVAEETEDTTVRLVVDAPDDLPEGRRERRAREREERDRERETQRVARRGRGMLSQWNDGSAGEAARLEVLEEAVAAQREQAFARGDTSLFDHIDAQVYDSLMAAGWAVEDIRGQMEYIEQQRRERALEEAEDAVDLTTARGEIMAVDRATGRTETMEEMEEMEREGDGGDAPRLELRRGLALAPGDSMALAVPAADSAALAGPAGDTVQRYVLAYRNVRMFKSDMQGVCDSLTGFSKDSTLHMYVDPVLWNGDNQITADVIDVYTLNREIDRVRFIGGEGVSPMMISQVDTLHYNQIRGRDMTAWFRDNNVYRHDVFGNMQNYYYQQDEASGQIDAFTVMSGADMSFYFSTEDRELDQITWRQKLAFASYPMDQIPADQPERMEGFAWHVDRRPGLRDVFDRMIKPSQREQYEAMGQPAFPLTDKITAHREQLVRGGTWRERDDTLTPATEEFIRSVTVE